MSIRFFKDREHTLHNFDNPGDILNPLKHDYIFSDQTRNRTNDLTVAEYFAAVKQLYDEHNIRSNPWLIYALNLFLNGYSQAKTNTILNVLINATDGNPWIYNYIQLDNLSYNSLDGFIDLGFIIYKPQPRITIHETEFTLRLDDDRMGFSTRHRTNDSTPFTEWMTEKLREFLTPHIERFNMLYTTHGAKKYRADNMSGISRFSVALFEMLKGYPCIRTTAGRSENTLSATQLRELDPTSISVTVTRSADYLSWQTKYQVRLTKANKTPLHNVFNYSTSPMDLGCPWPIKLKNEQDPVLYGVELECATNYNVNTVIDACDEPFMIAKSDGSVNGNKRNKYELVTVPMSFKAHKREWAKWFSKLDYNQFDVSKDTNNGFHVHIGRSHFDNKRHIRNLAWLINNPANERFMLMLSERTDNSFRQYSPVVSWGENHSKSYAIKNVERHVNDLRGACNLRSNKPTVEIRLFRGIVSYAAILKNLECVDAMFHYSSAYPFQMMTTKHFVDWLRKQPSNKYMVFRKWVESQAELSLCIAASDVHDVIVARRDPDTILSMIKKSKMRVSNEHVIYLNRRAGKRIFILNKSTGELELSVGNRFTLAHMDRDLEKRYVNL